MTINRFLKYSAFSLTLVLLSNSAQAKDLRAMNASGSSLGVQQYSKQLTEEQDEIESACDDNDTLGEARGYCCTLLDGDIVPNNPDGTGDGHECDLPEDLEDTNAWEECTAQICNGFDGIFGPSAPMLGFGTIYTPY